MEIESQESPSKQRNPKYLKSLKIRSKSLETFEISESSQMKKQTLKPKLYLNKINSKHTKIKKSITHKIIQWNCRGYKANYDKLLLFIAELSPTAICLWETLKKHSDKLRLKPFEQYDYIIDTGQELQVEY